MKHQSDCNRDAHWRKKHTFFKKVLRRRSGVSLATISTHTCRAAAVEARLFKLLVKNLVPETTIPIEVLENVTFQQNWPREYFWERGSGPSFRPLAGPPL